MFFFFFSKICDFIMLLILTALLPVEILSGGESEGGSLEEHVGQETQVPQSIANPHGDDKSVVRHLCQVVQKAISEKPSLSSKQDLHFSTLKCP